MIGYVAVPSGEDTTVHQPCTYSGSDRPLCLLFRVCSSGQLRALRKAACFSPSSFQPELRYYSPAEVPRFKGANHISVTVLCFWHEFLNLGHEAGTASSCPKQKRKEGAWCGRGRGDEQLTALPIHAALRSPLYVSNSLESGAYFQRVIDSPQFE